MSIFVAVVLGVVQGLTEFLPVSSSGHLVLLEKIFGINSNLIFLNVFLHLGTLCAVVVYYRKRLLWYIKHPLCHEVKCLAVATVPTVIIFLLFKNFFENSFDGSYLVFGFLTTAVFLVICHFVGNRQGGKQLDYKTAFTMGVFQGVAIMPGISRSGSTISSGVVSGGDKKSVADFSFLMSLPIILASLVLELFKIKTTTFDLPILSLIIGFLCAFVFGLIAIKFMLKIVNKCKLYWFCIYLVLLSLVMIFTNF